MRTTIICALVLGCATPARQSLERLRSEDPSHPVYVGHSEDGQVVMATTHADAMHGLAVSATELGVAKDTNGDDKLICQKEMLTGSHYPTWTCRYPTEIQKQRNAVRNFFDQPKSCTNCISR
jgi:phosphoglucomutase